MIGAVSPIQARSSHRAWRDAIDPQIHRGISNGLLLGIYFALIQDVSTSRLAIALLFAGAFCLNNWSRFCSGLQSFNWTAASVASCALLFGNVAIKTWQLVSISGAMIAVKTGLADALLLVMLCQLFVAHLPRSTTAVVLTCAFAFSWFGALNIIAAKFELLTNTMQDRTDVFTSYYFANQYRWQAPLMSSWQVSGLLRWSLPILALALFRANRLRNRVVLLFAAAFTAYVLVMCEYRAAIFPLLGVAVWIVLRGQRKRAALAVAFVAYAIAAPLISYTDIFERASTSVAPTTLHVFTGEQDVSDVASLTGRTALWTSGIDVLLTGKYLWTGEGQAGLDFVPDIGNIWNYDLTLFRRLSYHQAALDILFIYGTVPGAALLTLVFASAVRGLLFIWNRKANSTDRDELSFSLLVLGLAALANCHDGFVAEHNWFFVISAIGLVRIHDVCRSPARLGHAVAVRPLWSTAIMR